MIVAKVVRTPFLLLGLALFLTSCTSAPSPQAATLRVSPASSTVTEGDSATTTFTATQTGSSGTVTWELTGPGSISTTSGGSTVYTPPAIGTASIRPDPSLIGSAVAILTATAGSLVETAIIVVESAPPPAEAIRGVWQASGGDEVFDFGDTYPLDYLDLSGAAGEGELFGANASTNVLACGSVIFGVLGEDVLAVYSEDIFGSTLLLQFDMPDDDTLMLTNDSGVSQTLSRVSTVPAAARCGVGAFTASFENIDLELAYSSNLLSDGTNLRVAGDDGKIYPVSTANGALGAGQDITPGNRNAIAIQAGTYWAHCWCGNVTDVERVQVGGVVLDEINTTTDLGNFLSVRSGTWDGTHLWLAGYNYDEETDFLLEVDSDAEPDTLVSATPFDGRFIAIAMHDGEMWALVQALGPKLVRLDPVVGQALETIALPDVSDRYAGLASLGGTLWLMTYGNNDFGIYQLAP